jgi:hypothetical protein
MFASLRKGYQYVVIVLASLVLALSPTTALAQTILRVDGLAGSPTPSGQGSNWGSDAYLYLQDALSRADLLHIGNPALVISIWVRGQASSTGLVYRPDQSAASPGGTNQRNSAFLMRRNVHIFGGFGGFEPGTQIGFELRRPSANRTTLTGEINNTSLRSDNCFHVVTARSTLSPFVLVDDSARLDGF